MHAGMLNLSLELRRLSELACLNDGWTDEERDQAETLVRTIYAVGLVRRREPAPEGRAAPGGLPQQPEPAQSMDQPGGRRVELEEPPTSTSSPAQ